MFTYVFKAKNTEGPFVLGDIEADRRQTAVTTLKRKGYYLLSVERQSRLSAILNQNVTLANRVSVEDKAIFTHQLATLLRAGMKLTTALNTLSRQTENKYLASVIKQMQADIEQSSSLSEAMNKAETIKYAINLAIDTKKPTRLAVNVKNKSYLLETATQTATSRLKVFTELFAISAEQLILWIWKVFIRMQTTVTSSLTQTENGPMQAFLFRAEI